MHFLTTRGMRRAAWIALGLVWILGGRFTLLLQAEDNSHSELALAQSIVQKQLQMMHQPKTSYRYMLRKSDEKGTVVREEIVTPYGRVGRLLSREGKSLTAEEDQAERERLQLILDSPSEQKKKLKQDKSANKLTEELVSVMPQAMIYTLRPGQPQLPGVRRPQVVLDFKPNPTFHPSSTAQEALTGLQGTLWADQQDHTVMRMEGEVIRATNLVFGLVARIYPGGKLEFEQKEYAPNHFAYSLLTMNLTIRELLVKTQKIHTSQRATAIQPLPDDTSLEAAVRLLLDTPRPVPAEFR